MEKFTDAHVQRDPSLWVLATRYLNTYVGQFPFLLEAKQAYHQGSLSIPAVRGVLNCMSADPKVINMPAPPRMQFDAGVTAHEAPGFEHTSAHANEADEVQIKPSYPYSIECKTKWRHSFAVSLQPQARLGHMINPSSHLRVIRDRNDVTRYAWYVNWYCDTYRYMGMRTNGNRYAGRYVFLTSNEFHLLRNGQPVRGLPNKGWKVCIKCQTELERGAVLAETTSH